MKEIASLIARAKKYLHSSRILIDEGDYESSCIWKNMDFYEDLQEPIFSGNSRTP